MSSIVRKWRTWRHGRKFAKIGKGCKFPHKYLEVDGHVELGDYCRFRNNVIMRTTDKGKIVFGNRSGASYYVYIEANNLVQIGDFTGIAEFTVIRDTNHLVYGTDAHWRYTPIVSEPVIIGNGCFIGSRCYIMPGVTIGDGAVIQAGSVVTRNVGPFEIWAGYPARKVAHRTENVPPEKMALLEKMLGTQGGTMRQDRYMDAHEAANLEKLRDKEDDF